MVSLLGFPMQRRPGPPCDGSNSDINGERVLPFKAQSFDAVEDIAEWGAW